MPIERKSYPVTEVKTDDELGTICAVVSVFNNVDSGKEIVRQGFFQKSIERKLPKGVWAHDWKQPIAKTLEARELPPGDPMLPPELMTLGGTYIKGQFNLETQRGREAYSDIKFGIIDEFSIGYSVIQESKDKATGARELIEGDWKEWSPVLVGMNDQTRLISIKQEEANSDPVIIKTVCDCSPESDVNDCPHIKKLLEKFSLKEIPGTESFESFESAGTALQKFAQKMRSNHEIRTKEGRVLSSSNRAKVQACKESMTALIADLDDLLAISEPKPKEKEIDVEALRTQSLRMQSLAVQALAQPSRI